jgi:SAM-dependent methyltransferase
VAPEDCLKRRLQGLFRYVSADWNSPLAALHADLTLLPFHAGAFDAIICNHVLEHIAQDRLALSELRRVLKPSGWACIQVPIEGDSTRENPAVVDPAERLKLYGQADHVRQYGKDFRDRLEAAGFQIGVFPKSVFLEPNQLVRISVECEEEVWICSVAK